LKSNTQDSRTTIEKGIKMRDAICGNSQDLDETNQKGFIKGILGQKRSTVV